MKGKLIDVTGVAIVLTMSDGTKSEYQFPVPRKINLSMVRPEQDDFEAWFRRPVTLPLSSGPVKVTMDFEAHPGDEGHWLVVQKS